MNRIRLTALSIALIGGVLSCTSTTDKQEEPQAVKSVIVQPDNEASTLSLPGKIRSSNEANLSFRIAGPIHRYLVKEGQFVRKGTTLVELDTRDYAIQLSATEAEYKKVKGEVDRIKQLHSERSVSDNDYEKAIYGLEQITAKYQAHRNALADTRLTAPADGYVGSLLRASGETIGAGMPVISFSPAGLPEVEVYLPATEFLRRGEFASFSCTTELFPDTNFPLELVSIEQSANMNQLYAMRLRFTAQDKQTLPTAGLTAMVQIQLRGENKGLVSLPNTALFERDGKSFVWVISGKEELRVSAQEIQIVNLSRSGEVVCSGLSGGQRIVSAGAKVLTEGQAVRLLPEISNTNVGGLL